MARMKALLLAGGFGTRLKPLTDTIPKCLVPVGGKALLDYWYDALEVTEITDVLLNTHHLADQVRTHIAQTNENRPITVTEAYEEELLGSAGTVAANRAWADDASEVLVIYADNLSTVDIADFIAFHRSHSDPATMGLFHTEYPKKCGIATLDPNARITAFVEKPDNPNSDLANAGLYILSADLWREIADMKVFDFGFDVLPHLIGRMRGYPIAGYHRDIGTPEALAQANADAGVLFS